MSDRLTPQELEELRRTHHEGEFAHPNGYDRNSCVYCGERWPCDGIRMLTELTTLRAQVQAAEALADAVAVFMPDGSYEPWPVFHIGNIKNGPDVVVDPGPMAKALKAFRAAQPQKSNG